MALGFFEYSGEIRIALRPTTIKHWSELTGWPLTKQQAETILKASLGFVSVLNDKEHPVPWPKGFEQKALVKDIKSVFRLASKR
tara:strand:+ start:436 stop:687 length:252 start_codon:yes stop_codon:yes gene_type:complete